MNCKSTCSLLCLLFTLSLCMGQAKAPNFTLTDIDGVTHDLYEYLGQNKAVIIDFSATWCGPCWFIHQEGYLDRAYENFGPDGIDVAQVLFIESDANTTREDLEMATNNSYGDWLTGTHYPVIDLDSSNIGILNDYNIIGFPTVFIISPVDSTMSEFPLSFNDRTIFEKVQSVATLPEGEELMLDVLYPFNYFCGATDNSQTFTVYNFGNESVYDAKFEISVNGNVVDTLVADGELASRDSRVLTLNSYVLEAGDNSFVITSLLDDILMTNNSNEHTFYSETAMGKITISGIGDALAEEDNVFISLNDANGNELFNSGPILNETAYEFEVEVPASGCYDLLLNDDFGDGMYEPVRVVDENEVEIMNEILTGGPAVAGFYIEKQSGNQNINLIEAQVSPNPVSDFLFVSSDDLTSTNVIITDNLGREILNQSSKSLLIENNRLMIDVRALSTGLYTISVVGDQTISSTRFEKF